MMLLGIYLHAAVAYSKVGGWPYKDGTFTRAFEPSLGLIHTFRMPVFYVMAGFFSALLVGRRGWAGFLANRAARILVPFVVGWAVIFTAVAALTVYGMNLGKPDALEVVLNVFASGEVLDHLHPMHLWFLEYLLLFYALFAVVAPVVRLFPEAVAGLDSLFRKVVASRWRAFALAAPTALTLAWMDGVGLDDPSGFLPEPKILLAYLVFFGAGWLLYRSADLLDGLRRWDWLAVALGTAAVFLHWILEDLLRDLFGASIHAPRPVHLALVGLSMWLFVFGFTGLFLRLDRPIPWLRYLSDSSYWLYLVHMPVLIAIQLVLAGFPWSAVAKTAALLAVSVPILLISYHFAVRPTWIGAALNGRRYPIGRSAPSPREEAR
jgi:glucans biosynthesis protein C